MSWRSFREQKYLYRHRMQIVFLGATIEKTLFNRVTMDWSAKMEITYPPFLLFFIIFGANEGLSASVGTTGLTFNASPPTYDL